MLVSKIFPDREEYEEQQEKVNTSLIIIIKIILSIIITNTILPRCWPSSARTTASS